VSNLIGVEDTARRLGISVWTVYRWARAGRLVSIQLGRRRLFAEEDLQKLISTARRAAPASSETAPDLE
jgi:excisionase family DNA binding protein